MKRIVLGLAGAFSLLVTALSPASALSAPAGSYQQSCSSIRVRGDQLNARCTLPQGGTGRTSIAISSCQRGDIANVNGQLTCKRTRYNRGNGNGYGNNGTYGTPPGGSYQSSCTNVQMRGSMLSGTCTAPNGNNVTSTLDASSCGGADIANRNGSLQCSGAAYNGYRNNNSYGAGPGGSYQSSCTNVQMRGSVLTATCTAPNGTNITSTINVSNCNVDIANRNGYLRCG